MDQRMRFDQYQAFERVEVDWTLPYTIKTLFNKVVAFVGVMAYSTHEIYESRVLTLGAMPVKVVGPDVDYLVVGNVGLTEWQDSRFAEVIWHAMNLREVGYPIEVLSEARFLQLLPSIPIVTDRPSLL